MALGLEDGVPAKGTAPTWRDDCALNAAIKENWLTPRASGVSKGADGASRMVCRETVKHSHEARQSNRRCKPLDVRTRQLSKSHKHKRCVFREARSIDLGQVIGAEI